MTSMASDLNLALKIQADLSQAKRELKALGDQVDQTGRSSAKASREAGLMASGWQRVGEAGARARSEIVRWETTTLGALNQGEAGWETYATAVETIARGRLARLVDQEAERRIAASQRWEAGAIRALRSYAAAASASASQTEKAFTKSLGALEDGLVSFITRGKLSFKSLADTVIAELARIAVRQSILGPLAKIGRAVLSGLSASAPAVATPTVATPAVATPVATGVYHGGGVAGLGTRRRAVPPEVFAAVPRYHGGGIASRLRPHEVPAILERGEAVFTKEQTRALGGAVHNPRHVKVEVIHQGRPIEANDAQVAFNAGEMVITIATSDVSQGGPLARTIETVYGLRRAVR